jgi:hypothetical protein
VVNLGLRLNKQVLAFQRVSVNHTCSGSFRLNAARGASDYRFKTTSNAYNAYDVYKPNGLDYIACSSSTTC